MATMGQPNIELRVGQSFMPVIDVYVGEQLLFTPESVGPTEVDVPISMDELRHFAELNVIDLREGGDGVDDDSFGDLAARRFIAPEDIAAMGGVIYRGIPDGFTPRRPGLTGDVFLNPLSGGRHSSLGLAFMLAGIEQGR